MRRKFSPTIKSTLFAAIALFALLSTARPDSSGSWSFAALGDSRDNPETFSKIISLIAQDPNAPELVFHTGDMVNRGSSKKSWAQYVDAIAPLKGKIPLYPVLGNHETLLDKKAKNFIKYAQPPEGKTYYSLKHKNAGFVALNTYEPGHAASIGPEQLEWLKTTLASLSKEVDAIFVFMHKPLVTRPDYHHPKPLKNADEVKKILSGAGVKAVFMGHEHRYDHNEEDGVHYILTAGAGAPLYGSGEDVVYHYVRVTVSGKSVVFTMVNDKGEALKEIKIQ